MRKYSHTPRAMQRRLRQLWRAGAAPVAMIRHLVEAGYLASRVGGAFADAFGIGLSATRFASGWREDGTGVQDDVANQRLAAAIAAAAPVWELEAGDDAFLEAPRQQAALHVLQHMWDAGASTIDMVRWLRACGVTGDVIDDAFRAAFRWGVLTDRFTEESSDGTGLSDERLSSHVSQALADAEAAVIAAPRLEGAAEPEPSSDAWFELAGRGESPITAQHARRVLRAMWRAALKPQAMMELLHARGLEPDAAGAVFVDAFGLDPTLQAYVAGWLTRDPDLQPRGPNQLLGAAIEQAERTWRTRD